MRMKVRMTRGAHRYIKPDSVETGALALWAAALMGAGAKAQGHGAHTSQPEREA